MDDVDLMLQPTEEQIKQIMAEEPDAGSGSRLAEFFEFLEVIRTRSAEDEDVGVSILVDELNELRFL